MSSTHLSSAAATRVSSGRLILHGAGAGVVASLAMAMYAMVSSWAKGTGFLTPLYHIASLLASTDSMTASMKDAASGSAFYIAFGPAVLGAMIHMMTGAMYGLVFVLLARRLSSSAAVVAGAGLGYGAVVFAMSSWIALPLAAKILGSGAQINNMAQMAGYGTFLVEHLLFGLALGLLVALRPTRTGADA